MTTQKRARLKSLAHGRPHTAKPPASLSSKATRTLIRTHHLLEKRRKQALSEGNDAAATRLTREIDAHGGIRTYQAASLLGQGNDRGGDSSKVLMDWLKPLRSILKARGDGDRLRLLEVGALSTNNICSRSGLFDIERIDLNSQAEGILQQDFMKRPIPKSISHKFDIISLSLVLNYVPDPVGRGEMLKHTLKFMRLSPDEDGQLRAIRPCLFLVLPAPCITNSRYMDEFRLEAIMKSFGYVKMQQKLSNKLVYYLWKADDLRPEKRFEGFKKVELRAGTKRNNFAIVVR
ncbi:MAG: hypothetical protein M1818_000293 [Claussenomyces sp. TS43310]|nr:MAG: hypothetical protein M1818_000293 [Claussenomyces sp. TS43310]